MLHLFSFFHLNLAFSSIEEEQRQEVIDRCYWPLLRLIRDQRIPAGIEASGYTLEEISRLSPDWIEELKLLCREGVVEFIGSGYTQIIGPLVPAAINRMNQRIGLQIYQDLLGFLPEIVLVNEQAYAAGLVSIYHEAGYQAMIMEWDNPKSAHPEWSSDWCYFPQYACDTDSSTLPVIWNKSIPFQKFQRYVHGEMELPEYFKFLASYTGNDERTFSLYGNDAEIFNFRPGRFQTESVMSSSSEWDRIASLYQSIQNDQRFTLIRPSQCLDFFEHPDAGNNLHLESPAQPIPVKKQAKYNLMRWALTGRDDLGLNTTCWQLYEFLVASEKSNECDWKELCYLWSSDFRTHITPNRWQGVQERLTAFQRKIKPHLTVLLSKNTANRGGDFVVKQKGAFLDIETPSQHVCLNCHRGLTIESWWDKRWSEQPLIKTLPHGYFDDIHYGADFYTGHFVLEVLGKHKITDLTTGMPQWKIIEGELVVSVEITTPLGRVRKEILIDGLSPEFDVAHHFCWPNCPNGTLHLGHVTLNPELFQINSLFYRTHNGGEIAETFHLGNSSFNHLAPVSTLVSASDGLGVTSGFVELGDARHSILVAVDKSSAALTGHIVYAPVGKKYFYRLIFSAMETDDTSCNVPNRQVFSDRTVRLRIKSNATVTVDK